MSSLLQKLKLLADSAKGVILFILTPLSFIGGFIYYLLVQNSKLKEGLKEAQEEATHEKTRNEEAVIDEDSKHSSDDYAQLRDAYLRSHGDDEDGVH